MTKNNIHKLLVLILSILFIALPRLNNFNLSLLIDNIYLKIICVVLVVFSIMENYLVGIITMMIFFHILLLNNKQIKEGFFNYYEKKNVDKS
jgi:hypothetical protein